MLFSRYGYNAKYIMQMPFDEGIEMLMTAQRMNNEEKLFMRWVVSYQTTMKYEDFKRQLHIDDNDFYDDRTEDEILNSVKQILEGTHGTEHI